MTRFLPVCHTHTVPLFIFARTRLRIDPRSSLPKYFRPSTIRTLSTPEMVTSARSTTMTRFLPVCHTHTVPLFIFARTRLRIDPRSSLPKYFRPSTIRTLSTPEMVTSARSTTMTRFLPGEQVADTDMSPTPRRRRPAQLAFMGSLPQSQGST